MKGLDPVQFCVLLSFIELGIWRIKNRLLPLGTRSLETKGCRGRVGRRATEELVQGHQERSQMRSAWRGVTGAGGKGGLSAGGQGPALPALESAEGHTGPAPGLPAWLSPHSALSTAPEVCGLKGARSRVCNCGLGLQSPKPTAIMVGKGAKGMLVSTGTRLQGAGGHEHCLYPPLPPAPGPSASCLPYDRRA